MDLTAVIACKDRPRNIEFCVKSIVLCNPRPRLTVVDFGSNVPLKKSLERIFPDINVIRVERETMLFHKTRALNIGIKDVSTPYVCLTDADQIFQPNFFGVVREALERPNIFVTCNTAFLYALPGYISVGMYTNAIYQELFESARNSHKPPHGEGCCNAVAHDWLIKVGGLDEQYIGWGYEDKDLLIRAMYSGLIEARISDRTYMVHLPHERDEVYFNKHHRLRNQEIFERRKATDDVVVNVGKEWGQM